MQCGEGHHQHSLPPLPSQKKEWYLVWPCAIQKGLAKVGAARYSPYMNFDGKCVAIPSCGERGDWLWRFNKLKYIS